MNDPFIDINPNTNWKDVVQGVGNILTGNVIKVEKPSEEELNASQNDTNKEVSNNVDEISHTGENDFEENVFLDNDDEVEEKFSKASDEDGEKRN